MVATDNLEDDAADGPASEIAPAATAPSAAYHEAMQAGLAAMQAQDIAAARADFQTALALAGTEVEKLAAKLQIGMTHLIEGNFAPYRATIAEVFQSASVPPAMKVGTQISLGNSYHYEGEEDQARLEYAKAIASPDASPLQKADAQMAIGRSYVAEKKYEQARTEYDKVLALPELFIAHQLFTRIALAKTYLNEGKFSQARTEYGKALGIDEAGLEDFLISGVHSAKELSQLGIGESYLAEQNYNAAKEAYNNVLLTANVTPANQATAKQQLEHIAALEKAQ